jgi:hypothetical protein
VRPGVRSAAGLLVTPRPDHWCPVPPEHMWSGQSVTPEPGRDALGATATDDQWRALTEQCVAEAQSTADELIRISAD